MMNVRAFASLLVGLTAFWCECGAAATPVAGGPRGVPTVSGTVEILGAAREPGRLKVDLAGLSLADAIRGAGGYSDRAYPLGIALLRRSRGAAESVASNQSYECLPLAERQVAREMSDLGIGEARQQELERSLLAGERYRVPIPLTQIANVERQLPELMLIDGDILLIPSRPAHVYLDAAEGLRDRQLYEAGRLAEDYARAAGMGRRAFSDSDVLVLPSGEIQTLETGFWNYRPRAVPPGALLVLDADAGGCAVDAVSR